MGEGWPLSSMLGGPRGASCQGKQELPTTRVRQQQQQRGRGTATEMHQQQGQQELATRCAAMGARATKGVPWLARAAPPHGRKDRLGPHVGASQLGLSSTPTGMQLRLLLAATLTQKTVVNSSEQHGGIPWHAHAAPQVYSLHPAVPHWGGCGDGPPLVLDACPQGTRRRP